MLLSLLYEGRDNGTCVEVGAYDGVTYSNTYYLEQRGWQCILVEPSPEACRSIRQRRKAMLFEGAASSQKGTLRLTVGSGGDHAGAFSSVVRPVMTQATIRRYGGGYRELEVACLPLDEILANFGVSRVDFVSIDVEGHELDVLKGFALERYRPRLLIIEDGDRYSPPEVPDWLWRAGYAAFLRTTFNLWYARREDRELVTRAALVHSVLVRRLRRMPGLSTFVNWARAGRSLLRGRTP